MRNKCFKIIASVLAFSLLSPVLPRFKACGNNVVGNKGIILQKENNVILDSKILILHDFTVEECRSLYQLPC